MKLNRLMLIAISMFPVAAIAQNKQLNFKYAIKLYNTSQYFKDVISESSRQRVTNSGITLFKPTVAFTLKAKNQNFHELELNSFSGRLEQAHNYTRDSVNTPWSSSSGSIERQFDIQLRYEYIINFMKAKDSKWLPSLGISAMPFFQRYTVDYSTTASYGGAWTNFGVKAFVIPRISYMIGKRFFVEANLPIGIGEINYQHQNIKDPSIPQPAQKYGVNNMNLYFKPGIRLGIGLRF